MAEQVGLVVRQRSLCSARVRLPLVVYKAGMLLITTVVLIQEADAVPEARAIVVPETQVPLGTPVARVIRELFQQQ